jgi:hypothetical protein
MDLEILERSVGAIALSTALAAQTITPKRVVMNSFQSRM